MAHNSTMTLSKRFSKGDKTREVNITIEEISNGWLVTKCVYTYGEGDMKDRTIKTYFKTNPMEEEQSLADKFDDEIYELI